MTAIETIQTEISIPQETLKAFNGDELRARVFYEKYALRDESGKQVETLPEQMWRRVSKEIASVEKTEELRKEWQEKFYWLLSDWKFIPGGRILFGAGQSRKSTLLNCYVIPIKEDSLEAIFDWCKEAARTYSYGGGVGTDISILRPKGAAVNNSAIASTGAVSFMEVMSTTTGTIGQAGRRGALMISISVEHPDIEDFITIKKSLKNVNFANVSVRITDEFMNAVKNDKEFNLHFKNDKVEVNRKVRAKDIWTKLVTAARDSAEPGLLFWDNMVKGSTTEYNDMNIVAVNPCAEISLDPYGCCCLGSINLSYFVNNSFKGGIISGELYTACGYATRFLDDVLDYNASKHPLDAQSKTSLQSRRIGVGFTGLGDMLIKMGIKYDSDEALNTVNTLFNGMKNSVYMMSTSLAKEKGKFPAFNATKHLNQPFIQTLSTAIQSDIKELGLRNAALLTVPPVGSGSILVGSSSGIEPVFALEYKRRSKSLSKEEYQVTHPLINAYFEANHNKDSYIEKTIALTKSPPDYFITAHQIEPEFRVKMQATIQKHIDHSISSTVNLPQDATVEDVEKIYFQAWKLGCKGITVYREGSRQGILESNDIKKEPETKTEPKVYTRPKVMHGQTIKLKLAQGNLYLTVNSNGDTIPREVFVELGKYGGDEKADAEAIGRLISLYLQGGGTIDTAIKALKGIRGKYVIWDDGVQMLSIPDAIAKGLEILTQGKASRGGGEVNGDMCPNCQDNALIHENGCTKCGNCDYSKCE